MTLSHAYYRDGGVEPQFAELMVMLAEACSARITEAQIRTFALLLGDIELEDLRRGVLQVGRRWDRAGVFPAVGDVRKAVQPTIDDAALMAWTALDRAAGIVGAYASVDIEDAAGAFALASVFGSWPAFCAVEQGPQLALKRQEFLAAYRQAMRDGAYGGPVRFIGTSGAVPVGGWMALIASDGRVELDRADRFLRPTDVAAQLTR